MEYGGLQISQKQFKKAKNGANILGQIKKQGKGGKIYYRSNGMVFVNYKVQGENRNVSLKLEDGVLKDYYKESDYGETSLEKATHGGIIHKAISKCVKYPKTFSI